MVDCVQILSVFSKDFQSKLVKYEHTQQIQRVLKIIVDSLDYEISKFRDHRASVIFTGNLSPSTLFSMESYQQFSDIRNGMKNVLLQLDLLQTKYNIDCRDEVCRYFYQVYVDPVKGYLEQKEVEDKKSLAILESILTNRFVWEELRTQKQMQQLLDLLQVSKDEELQKIVKPILVLDPLFAPLQKHAQHILTDSQHNSDAGHRSYEGLSIDFYTPVVNFLAKISAAMFNKTVDKPSSEKDNFRFYQSYERVRKTTAASTDIAKKASEEVAIANEIYLYMYDGKWYQLCARLDRLLNTDLGSTWQQVPEISAVVNLKSKLEQSGSPLMILSQLYADISEIKSSVRISLEDINLIEDALAEVIVSDIGGQIVNQADNDKQLRVVADVLVNYPQERDILNKLDELRNSEVTSNMIEVFASVADELQSDYLSDYYSTNLFVKS